MKKVITIILNFLAVILTAQTYTVTCHVNDYVDKRVACSPCNVEDELFTGLIVEYSGTRKKIYAPVAVKIYSNRYFELTDNLTKTITRIDCTKVPGATTVSAFKALLQNCFEIAATSVDTSAVHKTGDETITGAKTIAIGNSMIVIDSFITVLNLSDPGIFQIRNDGFTIDRETTPAGPTEVLNAWEVGQMIQDSTAALSTAVPDTMNTKVFTGASGDSTSIGEAGILYHNKTDNPSAYYGVNATDGIFSRNSSSGADAFLQPGTVKLFRGSYGPLQPEDGVRYDETQNMVSDTADVLRTSISSKQTAAQVRTIVSDTASVLRSDISTKQTAAQVRVITSDTAAVLRTSIAGKQATLVSGTNIKTVNGNSLLGSGDLTISGGGSSYDWGRTDYASGGAGSTITYTGPAWTGTGTNTGATVVSANSTYYAYGYASNLFENASATTSQVAGFRQSANTIHRGQYGGGGFDITVRFSLISSVNLGINKRCFVGLNGATNAAPTDVNPSSKTNIVGIGWDATDATIYIFHNDASGTATRVNTSIDIPDEGINDVFVVTLYSEPGSSSITITADRLHDGGAAYSTTVSTDIPSISTIMYIDGYASAGGTSDSAGIRFINATVKTR